MIENIGSTGTLPGSGRDGKSGGGEIHGPEHQPGGGEINAAGVDNAEDFGAVQGEVAPGHRHAKPRDACEASRSGDVVEAGTGI